MKTKLKFLKENIILLLIFNILILFLIWIPINHFFAEVFLLYKIGTTSFVWLLLNIHTIDSWYNDYRFEELEKQIKELKDK